MSLAYCSYILQPVTVAPYSAGLYDLHLRVAGRSLCHRYGKHDSPVRVGPTILLSSRSHCTGAPHCVLNTDFHLSFFLLESFHTPCNGFETVCRTLHRDIFSLSVNRSAKCTFALNNPMGIEHSMPTVLYKYRNLYDSERKSRASKKDSAKETIAIQFSFTRSVC